MTDRDGRPDPLIVHSVVDIARILRAEGNPVSWSAANLFVPDTSERTALGELDLAVISELDVLGDTCLRPHNRLDRAEELVRSDVARRVPPSGLARLASHTEDWAAVEHGRIRPLRVLSQRYVEDVDFYENRVAAQLVDRLGEHLTRRIHELSTLAEGLLDLSEYEQALRTRQSWRRLDRVARLVARAISDTSASAGAINENLDRLLSARARLRALLSTPVLRSANRRARLPTRLMRTNLFTSDRRYRRIGALWERWAVQNTRESARRQAANSEFPRAYRDYVTAMSLRALAVLGYVPQDATPISGHSTTVRLSGPAGELTWSIAVGGVVTLAAGNEVLVRVIPTELDLSAAVPEPVRAEWLDQINRTPEPAIIAYPGLRADRAALSPSLRQRLHPVGFGSGVCVVPINPLEIEGEERMARALRWTVQGLRFTKEYPPEVQLQAPPHLANGAWFRLAGRQRIAILRNPSAEERAALDPSTETRQPRTRDDDSLDTALALFKLFETCPCCHTRNDVQARDRDTFQCTCQVCGTVWGTRVCGPCSKRYPILWPRNTVIDQTNGDRLDMTAGADVLSLPCADQHIAPGSRYRCPWCHRCGGQPNCGCHTA
ncbi:hypothetical protein [Lentzea sp. HUAS12]|uniref:hypothetical protein n=1 Tax=Lentzea sp. HUAS12 TaxID=2951806 RepID=UPI0020A1ED03|nr:hypothetical protein [Lentzea sp. HUAS12]USX56242.1 hypothetical protein ND450_19710 [Lentzea sp. HUAS12]